MMRSTCAYVNLQNFKKNIQTIKSLLDSKTKFLAVVKANAYGHGILEISRSALEAGADFLGVAIPQEGEYLRENGIQAPILVLGGTEPIDAPRFVQNNLIPAVYSIPMLSAFQNAACSKNCLLPIHFKIDTGMNRIGIKTLAELNNLLSYLQQNCPNLSLDGMFTHFAVSEESDKTFTLQQDMLFKQFVQVVKESGFSPILHASNSAAILDLPTLQYDMVRGGIAMYGCPPDPQKKYQIPLLPVMSWKTRVTYVKTVAPGETVGYGRTFTAYRPTKLATIPVGYGDGFKRLLSNKGHVLIKGKKAPIVGSVCMDQSTCDVSEIPNVSVGDEVVLLGQQGESCITAQEMANWAQTINYEVLLSISPRVPRIYL